MKAVHVILLALTYGCGGQQSSFGEHASQDESGRESADGSRASAAADKSDLVDAALASSYATWTDEFQQSGKPLLDILLVIDNSGSMSGYQGKLAANLAALLHYVRHSDWQIAVIGTKPRNCLSERITKNTPDFQSAYSQLVTIGAGGNGEYYFYKAIHGLKGWCRDTTSAWLRDSSTVAVLIVGDQHNECHGDSNDGAPLPSSAACEGRDLAAYLKSIRPEAKAKVYGIVPSAGRFNSYDPNALSIFHAYGHVSGSYDDTLQKISRSVHAMLDTFTLAKVPRGSAEVRVNGETLATAQYTIDAAERQLSFDQGYVPPEAAAIEVTYDYFVD